uniref:Uncharacterized protein n=1 Tax=Arundo donax TaxID=35708 RepID=A0A0A8Z5E9_ARUDO
MKFKSYAGTLLIFLFVT